MAVAHNGNLVNAPELRRKLELDGSISSELRYRGHRPPHRPAA